MRRSVKYAGDCREDRFLPLAQGDAGKDDDRRKNLFSVQCLAEHEYGDQQCKQRNQVDEGRGLAGWQPSDGKIEQAIGADGDEHAEIDDGSDPLTTDRRRHRFHRQGQQQEEGRADKGLHRRHQEGRITLREVLEDQRVAHRAQHGEEFEEIAELRVGCVLVGRACETEPDGAADSEQETGEAHARDPFAQEDEGTDGDEQGHQSRDHAGLRGTGVLQRHGLEDEVQAGLTNGEAEQVFPVAGAVVELPAPAPRGEENHAAEDHAPADNPHRRQFGEGDLQCNERTAPQGHCHQQTTHRLGPFSRLLHARLLVKREYTDFLAALGTAPCSKMNRLGIGRYSEALIFGF